MFLRFIWQDEVTQRQYALDDFRNSFLVKPKMRPRKDFPIFGNDVWRIERNKESIHKGAKNPHGRRIGTPRQKGQDQDVRIKDGFHLRTPFRARRSALAAAISALISSSVISGSSRHSADSRKAENALKARSRDESRRLFSAISNGNRCSRTVAFAKITNAVDIDIPTFSQNEQNSCLRSSSMRTLKVDCVIQASCLASFKTV